MHENNIVGVSLLILARTRHGCLQNREGSNCQSLVSMLQPALSQRRSTADPCGPSRVLVTVWEAEKKILRLRHYFPIPAPVPR